MSGRNTDFNFTKIENIRQNSRKHYLIIKGCDFQSVVCNLSFSQKQGKT